MQFLLSTVQVNCVVVVSTEYKRALLQVYAPIGSLVNGKFKAKVMIGWNTRDRFSYRSCDSCVTEG